MFGRRFRIALTALMVALTPIASHADTVHAAVAANFTAAIKRLTPLFEQQSGHQLLASFGASGQLYAQINNGAPFDLMLSADDVIPTKLVDEGLADPDSHFIYASGRLALWSKTPGYVDDHGEVLQRAKFKRIAIANPKTAPYGQAAMQTLNALGLQEQLAGRFITGENIAQTQQFVSTGNVPLGFVALAQVMALPEAERGSYWLVPVELHQPIDQGAVLLKRSKTPAAQQFLDFLRTPEAAAVIRELGYEVSSPQQ